MNKRRKAFTLIELLVVVAIIALLISILLPSLSRARELSKRLVCGSNVKGMGTAFKIYANDYNENWPTVPHAKSTSAPFAVTWVDPNDSESVAMIGFDYISAPVTPAPAPGAKPLRYQQSVSDTSSGTASTTLSTTRNMWILVRSGDVTPKQYVCPSSGDSVANEQNIDLYYDFKGKSNVSYGYQVPYGPYSSRASEDIDPRLAVAADKGPYSAATPLTSLPADDTTNWKAATGFDSPQDWRRFNSANHGGSGSGEGQNVLYGDGHATFEKTPNVGIDKDNIYTKMGVITTSTGIANITPMASGMLPSNRAANGSYYPGYHSLNGTADASTDSLIFP